MSVLTNFPNGGSFGDFRDTLNSMLSRLGALEAGGVVSPTLSLSSAVTHAEGDSGTAAFVWTLTLTRNGSTAAFPFTWAVTGNGSNPANAADFGGTLPSGSGTFATGETSKTITILVSGDTAVEPTETFLLTVTATGLNTVTSIGTISNDDTGSTGTGWRVILGSGDSTLNGVFARAAGDVDVTGVSQYKSRVPIGITSDITPLEQLIAQESEPTADPFSSMEAFGKAYRTATGQRVLLVGCGYNGTGYYNGDWSVGGNLYEQFIARGNAAIAAAQADDPDSRLVAVYEMLGTNDSGMTKAAFKTAKAAAMANARSRLTGGASVPWLHVGQLPEWAAGDPTHRNMLEGTQEVAAAGTNAMFVTQREGYNGGDYTHPSTDGLRYLGGDAYAVMVDTVAPTISSAASPVVQSGGPLAIALAADKYASYRVSGGADAAAFEIGRVYGTGGVGGINTIHYTEYLRLVGNANADYAAKSSYSVIVEARSAAGALSTKTFTPTVAQPYGVGDHGAITAAFTGVLIDGNNYQYDDFDVPGVPVAIGLNLFHLHKGGGNGTPQTMKVGGVPCTKLVATGGTGEIWGYVSSVAGTVTLTINTGNAPFNQPQIAVVTMNGTKNAVLESDAVGISYINPPVAGASHTCPSNGMIVGIGIFVGGTGPTGAGVSAIGANGVYFADKRTTTGAIAHTADSGNYASITTMVFEKSV